MVELKGAPDRIRPRASERLRVELVSPCCCFLDPQQPPSLGAGGKTGSGIALTTCEKGPMEADEDEDNGWLLGKARHPGQAHISPQQHMLAEMAQPQPSVPAMDSSTPVLLLPEHEVDDSAGEGVVEMVGLQQLLGTG